MNHEDKQSTKYLVRVEQQSTIGPSFSQGVAREGTDSALKKRREKATQQEAAVPEAGKTLGDDKKEEKEI